MSINWEAYRKKAKRIDDDNYRKNISNTDIGPVRTTGSSVKKNDKVTDIGPVRTTSSAQKNKKSLFDDGYDFGDITRIILNPSDSVKSVINKHKEQRNSFLRDYLTKGAFEDGYQKKDLSKTILGSQGDVIENIHTGMADMPEKIIDAFAQLAPYISQAQFNQSGGYYNLEASKIQNEAFEEMKKGASEFVAKDLYDAEEVGKKVSPFLSPATAISHIGSKILGVEDYDDVSVFAEKADALAQSAGQLGATAVASAAGVPWWLVSGATSFGGQAETALNEGASFDEATFSAAVSAGAEVLSEKISGGIKFGGKTLDDALTKKLASGISNKVVRSLAKIGLDSAGEGFEEVVSGVMSNLGTAIYKEEDVSDILFSEEAVQEYIDSAIGGLILGGGSSVGNAIKGKTSGVDPVTELNQSEQAVVDKVYNDEIAKAEKDGKKLNGKEKSKIYDRVLNNLEKGYIGIDTIESILGGETYNKYKETVDSEDALQNEFNALNKMKQGDMTGEQLDRRAELKQQLEALKGNSQRSQLKSQLNNEVMGLVKGSKLTESYNEKTRRSQHYEADLTQYNEKQRATIQKAIDSGMLNNTNRTHEFVDMLANISADKGVLFDFINNERLKNSSFAVEGKTVNGYKTDDGYVALNIDSSKSLNSVVGHEITHVLEGTEFYDALENVVKEYAKAKGEYGDRMIALRKLYTGVYKSDADGDFEARLRRELTADVVGEYLFTDAEFINNLSTEQPTLFKKIYNEIKYLCKVATAGSNEARALEKVKKTFEDAWKQNGTAQKNTADSETPLYSLNNNLENVGKILYDNNNPLSIVNRATSDNHSSINWVYKSEIFSVTENKLFHEKISEINQGSQAFEKNSRDEYMLPIGNKIVFTDGNYESPYIREIVEVLTDLQTEFEKIKERIFNVEKGEYEKQDAVRTIKQVFGDEIVVTYRSGNNGVYGWQNGKRKGKTRRTVVRNYLNKQHRAGNDKQGKEAQINDIAPVKETSSKDGVFFDGGKAKYSLSNTNNSSKDVYGFSVNKNAKVNEDLLEELSIYHPDAQVDSDGNVTVYHRTSKENADKIRKTGVMTALEDALFFSSKSEGYASDYGDTVLAFRIPSTVLRVNDIFDGEVHFDIPLKRINNQWSLNVSKYLTDENTQYSLSDSHKEKQLDIINKFNPAPNTYSAWVRSVDDIKSFEEALNDEEYAEYDEFNPDYDRATAEKAVEAGEITVYSSYPIKQGVFVTPSYMEAESYSGNGKVYSKTVSLDSVAWLDVTQGQYAPVEADTKQSLSAEDSQTAEHGGYNVHGEDIAYTEDIGPVRDDIPTVKKSTDATAEFIGGPVRKDIPVKSQASSDNVIQNNTPSDEEPVSITTVKERLEAKLNNATAELENNKKLRQDSIDRFNAKIADYQAKYEAKKNKDTKIANDILRSIERLKNNRDNNTADFDKRINDIEKRIGKITEQLQQDHTKEDNLERSLKRIDARLEREKAAAIEEFNRKKGKIEDATADKDAFISKKAYELYRELWGLKKGVRASQELSALLEYKPDWTELKQSLLHIKTSPAQRVNEDSSIESVAREIINTAYEDNLYSLDESYAELQAEIKALEDEAEKARQKARREDLGSIRKKKQGQYEQEVSELIGDTSSWRDKSLGLSYQTNTLHRNLRDVVRKDDGSRDIEKADRIHKYLQGSYNRNEAELKRESKRIKQVFIDMKINKYESEYIQMLGELRYYPGTTLTRDVTDAFYEQHKNKIDVDKVEKAITESRKVYDDLIQRVNAVLKEQGMKEIPYIKGYYPHFTKDKQGILGKIFNWKTVNNDIPTDIAGLTEMFKPVRSYQSFNKHREARETDYDFAQGFDTYVHGALDWIYHIEDIQRRRAFENVIRYRHSEEGLKNRVDEIKNNTELDADEAQQLIDLVYKDSKNPLGNFVLDIQNSTNNLAGKKSAVDRTMEYATNRHVYSTMTNISNRVSANAIAGSISSAMTNFIPITQSWGQVNPVYSLYAAKDAVRNAFKDDGMINKSTFMTNRLIEEENLKKTPWDIAGEKLGLLMNVADHFTTEVVWRSKYLQNIKNGMSESEAIDNADIFAENVMAGRSRGNMPTIFNSKNPVTKTLTAFQLEVANQYGYMFKDMPQEIGEKNIGKLVSGYTRMFVGAFVYNALFSALTGRDAAFDPIGIIVDLCKDLGLGSDDEEEETNVFGAIKNFGENVAQNVPFVGGLLGGGRIPISSALPYELSWQDLLTDIEGAASDDPDTYRKRLTKEFLKPLYYLAMPMGGGQLKKTVEGLKMFDDDLPIAGSYTDSGDLRFPVDDTFGNKLQAAVFGQYASENAQLYFDEGYKPLNEKQIREYKDLELPIADYWKYREGLAEQETVEDKFEYINSLNVTDEQKNIMINNAVDRKEAVDMSNYDKFADYEEFDFYVHNKEKYKFLQSQGVSYKDYNATEESREAYNWAYNNPEKYVFSQSIAKDVVEYRQYSSALDEIRADKDDNGNSISGSAKAKKWDYINSLDIDEGAKYILFKSEYKSDDTYNYEIVDYLNSRDDISRSEMITILEQLGAKVDSEGYIDWD